MNLGKSFSYVFEDQKWIETILIGGLITLIPILGQLYVAGFMVEAARRVVEGKEDLLPEWGEVGQKIVDGFKFFVITFVYALPAIAIALLVGIPGGLLASMLDNGGQASNIGLFIAICMATCFIPFLILLGILLQMMSFGGLVMFIRSGHVGDGLKFREAYRMINGRVGDFLILWLVQILAGIVAGLGSIFFGFGVLFTTVYAQAMFGNYFGQFAVAAGQSTDVVRQP